MNHNTYCFWLMISLALGNQPSIEECRQLNAFLKNQNS